MKKRTILLLLMALFTNTLSTQQDNLTYLKNLFTSKPCNSKDLSNLNNFEYVSYLAKNHYGKILCGSALAIGALTFLVTTSIVGSLLCYNLLKNPISIEENECTICCTNNKPQYNQNNKQFNCQCTETICNTCYPKTGICPFCRAQKNTNYNQNL